MINILHPAPDLISAGQPNADDIHMLKNTGVTRAINLRQIEEDSGFDDQAAFEDAGIDYIQIPIAPGSGFTVENAKKLDDALKSTGGKSLVYCKTGNRVGIMLGLRALHIEGKSPADSIAFAENAGMTVPEEVKSKLFG